MQNTDRQRDAQPSTNRRASPSLGSVLVQLTVDQLRPLVEAVVGETIRQLEADRQHLNGGVLAYSEAEAAKLLGLEEHQLRDERRRGRIRASQIVGRRIRYQRGDLLAYLAERRVNGDPVPPPDMENGGPR
jgi:hypothetical protein